MPMRPPNRIRKSLVASFWDGIFASCTAGFTTDYVTPFALVLKATVRQIGYLSAVPFLVSSFTQLISADIAEKFRSRKKAIVVFVLCSALMFVPIMFTPFVFSSQPVFFLVVFVALYTGFNTLVAPIWSGLMTEYIPPRKRGHYFGWRNKIMSIVMIAASLGSGCILQRFRHDPLSGFMIILGLAFGARLISWYFLTRMYEPAFKVDKGAYFSILDFVRNIRHSNFARFTLFVAGMQFCVNLASPFFSVFMLKDLRFNYLTYTVLVTTVTGIQIFTIGRWGRCADRIGNIRVLKLSAVIIASLPLWWLIWRHPAYLLFAQVVSGFAWSGFNLCTGNFIYDATTPAKRIRCFGYLSVFVGLAVCLGGILGGYLAHSLPAIFGYRLLTLFLLSSILRFCVAFFLGRGIKEVRPVEEMPTGEIFLRIAGLKPVER
jgi:MFS family permease